MSLLATAAAAAQTVHNLSVTSVTPPASPTTGIAGNYVVALGGTSGAPGVRVTVVFSQVVTVNLGASSPTNCTTNTASADTSVTVSCPATGLTSVSINATPLAGGTLNIIAGVIGSDYDNDVSNNSATATTSVTSNASGTKFWGMPPCRVFDTRNATGPYGGPALAADTARAFGIAGQCGVPAGARAIIGNFTAVGSTVGGTITVYPSSAPRPLSDVLGYATGQTIAGLATVALDASGSLTVYPAQTFGTVNLVLDVSGYFQ
ncbi:MAG TPA: hypothetical protein VKE50_06555 [Thermoanaerobaculia bacterium]|nr:hypothetical protein [Thermoanaerobaculia bacterium]